MKNKELFKKWVLETNNQEDENYLHPMTGNQYLFAKFLFNNLKELTPMGNVTPIFESVYKFVKSNRKEVE